MTETGRAVGQAGQRRMATYREFRMRAFRVPRKQALAYAAAVLALAVSQAYLLPKVLHAGDGLDFRLIWLAGQLWNDGISPYSNQFLAAYHSAFGDGPISHFWVYPPYWAVIAGPMSLLSFENALTAWNLVNYLLLLLSSGIIATLLPARAAPLSRGLWFIRALCILSLAQATPFSIALGQTSMLILAGCACLLAGLPPEKWSSLK
ncbi:MAG: glycosyltransferase 87 family protein [Rhodovulum sp.]